LGVIPSVNAPFGTRKTFTPDYSTANTIKLVVAGASKAIAWTGATDSAWSIGAAGPLNWNDGVIDERFFNADAVTFGDGPTNRTVTITGITVVPASVTVNNSAGNDYAIGGTGVIGGAAALTKSGSGALTLTSANTYSGGTTLNSGTLNINNASALGAASFSINGGSLGNTSGAPITLTANNPQNWNGNFAFSGPNDLDLGLGAVTLNTTPTVTVNTGTLKVGGVISGDFGLAKSGAGSLVLSGGNAYVGGTVLSAGTLAVNHATALGSGTLTINGGGLDNTSGALVTLTPGIPQNWNADFTFTGSNPLNLGTGLVVLGASPNINVIANTLTVGGIVGGAFGLTKSGAGTLVLAGASNYSGATNINAGTARVTNAAITPNTSSLGALSGGAVNIAAGATVDLSGSTTQDGLNFGAKQFNIAGTGVGGAGAIINNGVRQLNALQHVALTADATVGGSQRFDIRSVPTSSLASTLDLAGHTLTKIGANQFSLVGTDVSDGYIVVNGGTFSIETVTNIPDFQTGTNITFNAGTTFQVFSNTADPSTVLRPIIFNGAGFQIGSASNNNNSIIGCPMFLNGDVTVAALNNTNNTSGLTLTGDINESGGARSVTKTGPSTLVLTGTNSWSGTTTVQAGTLRVGSADALPAMANLVISGGTVDLNNNFAASFDAGAKSLAGTATGTLTNSDFGNLRTFTVNQSSTTEYSGAISGNLSLVKAGAGTLTLSGVLSNPELHVNAGVLNLNSVLTNATITNDGGTLNVNANATDSTVNANSGGTGVHFTVSQTLTELNIGAGGVVVLEQTAPLLTDGEIDQQDDIPASSAASLTNIAVPEPGTATLLVAGLISLCFRRRAH
jgi:autotransporter-associated beta strand protein